MSETTDQTENQDLVIEEDEKIDKEKYLAAPDNCPYCESDYTYCIDEPSGDLLLEWLILNKDIPLDMECGSCNCKWVRIYRHKINDVEFKS